MHLYLLSSDSFLFLSSTLLSSTLLFSSCLLFSALYLSILSEVWLIKFLWLICPSMCCKIHIKKILSLPLKFHYTFWMIHLEKKVKTSIKYFPKAAQKLGRKQLMPTTRAMLIPDFTARQSLRAKHINSCPSLSICPKNYSTIAIDPKQLQKDKPGEAVTVSQTRRTD